MLQCLCSPKDLTETQRPLTSSSGWRMLLAAQTFHAIEQETTPHRIPGCFGPISKTLLEPTSIFPLS